MGASVFYGASAVEARAQQGRVVYVVGGGNSAGQAALHLARYAASVSLIVRGPSLAESMSAYLITQLEALGVRILTETTVVDAHADAQGERLAEIVVEHVTTGERRSLECQTMFIAIGAQPQTEWLPPEVLRDQWGFVFTGSSEADDDAPDPWHGARGARCAGIIGARHLRRWRHTPQLDQTCGVGRGRGVGGDLRRASASRRASFSAMTACCRGLNGC